MEKWWIEFEKDFEDKEKNKFVKGKKIELDKTLAEKLVELGVAKKIDKPATEDNEIITKALAKAAESLENTLSEMISKSFEKINTQLAEKIRVTVKSKTPFEEYSHKFNNAADYYSAVVKSCSPGAQVDERFTKAPQGLTTIDDVDGGFLVPDTEEQAIWEGMMKDDESILPLTTQKFTSGNNLKTVRITETSRKDGYRHGGMLAYWLDEADEFTKSQIKFGKLSIDLHKLAALTYITEEELDDARSNPMGISSRMAAKAIMFKVNEAFLLGTGVGKPKGVLREDALCLVEPENGQLSTEILHSNIRKMYYRLRKDFRVGAKWYIHPNVEEILELIQFNNNTSTNVPAWPIYWPGGNTGLTAQGLGTMKGIPVVPCEYCSDLGSFGDISLINWSEYVSLQKTNGGIKSAESMHVRFLYEERAFRWSYRIGGASMWSSPQEDYKGTKTRGPFVALGQRDTSVSSGI